MKEPWLAVCLSLIYPGIGQIYAGRKIRGVIFLALQLCLYLIFIGSILWVSYGSSFRIPIFFYFLMVLFSVYSLADAYRTAVRFNLEHKKELPLRRKKPFFALFLSILFPGLGQFYNGDCLKGLLFLILIPAVTGALTDIRAWGPLQGLFFQIVATMIVSFDAYIRSKEIDGYFVKKLPHPGSKKAIVFFILLILFPFFSVVGLSVTARTFLVQAFKIPGDSMSPTLMSGDRIFVNKLNYKLRNPARGDLVVVTPPAEPSKKFVRRIVGLPGEEIKIQNGNIYINSQLVHIPQIGNSLAYKNREDWEFGKSGQAILVPEGMYFVLGDNSDKSADSRIWGCVHRKSIRGKVYAVYWPLENCRRVA